MSDIIAWYEDTVISYAIADYLENSYFVFLIIQSFFF